MNKTTLIMHPICDENGRPIEANVVAYAGCVRYIAEFIERRAEIGDISAEMLLECFIANVKRSMKNPPLPH